MEDINEKNEIPLSCGHWFHTTCLTKWNKPECPMCRTAMSSDDSKVYVKHVPRRIMFRNVTMDEHFEELVLDIMIRNNIDDPIIAIYQLLL